MLDGLLRAILPGELQFEILLVLSLLILIGLGLGALLPEILRELNLELHQFGIGWGLRLRFLKIFLLDHQTHHQLLLLFLLLLGPEI